MSRTTSPALPTPRTAVVRVLAATALALLALLAWAPSRASAQTEISCFGFTGPGSSPGENSVDYFFSCDEDVHSFRVTVSKPISGFNPAPFVEAPGGDSHPGFVCSANIVDPAHSFTCFPGMAAARDTVHGGFGTQQPPCPVTVTVVAGTGPPDATGTPTQGNPPPPARTFFNLKGNRCEPPPRRSPCVDQPDRDRCEQLAACFSAGAAMLQQEAAAAVTELRNCVFIHRRFRLHSHTDGLHLHQRRRIIRRSRSVFWRLYKTAQKRQAQQQG
jgi:hypothetical protein